MGKTITVELESGITVSAPPAVVSAALMEHLARERTMKSFVATIRPLFSRIDAPEIGALWPGQGGYNGGYFPARGDVKGHYLIVSSLKDEPSLSFGGYDKKVPGADDKDDGLKNCQAIMASGHEHLAAKFCLDYREDGHADYFLGARRQMLFLAATVPQLFNPDQYYWTSTRDSSSLAIVQGFDGGDQDDFSLRNEFLVRPVRRYFIDSTI